MRQQLYNLVPLGSRRLAQREARNDAQEQIKQDGQARIDVLKKDFERESADLNQSYQNRISALADHYHNVESHRPGEMAIDK